MPSTLNIFCCYARVDGELLNKLTTHLMPLQRLGLITIWHDTHIEAGSAWEDEISTFPQTRTDIEWLCRPWAVGVAMNGGRWSLRKEAEYHHDTPPPFMASRYGPDLSRPSAI